ncbi:hypothetical protein FQA39_LY15237 [Lamprigera yunnana]|nr:hypothetical protein FQA39_LY15237 [Lamprigera yunnana]
MTQMKAKKNHANAKFLTLPARGVKQLEGPRKHVEEHWKYKVPLAVSAAKLKGFLNLCADAVIPRAYHDLYLNLKGTTKVNELPEPDIEDDSDNKKLYVYTLDDKSIKEHEIDLSIDKYDKANVMSSVYEGFIARSPHVRKKYRYLFYKVPM